MFMGDLKCHELKPGLHESYAAQKQPRLQPLFSDATGNTWE